MDNPETVLSSCKILVEGYRSQGQYNKALKCLTEYQLLYDSLFNAKKSQQIIEISAKYEAVEREKQNAYLEAQNANQQETQTILIVILAISLLFLVSVFLLLFQRKKTLKILSNQKKHFERLIENSEDFIVIVDAEGKIKYVSPSYVRKIGLKRNISIGHNLCEYIHASDIKKVKAFLIDILGASKRAGCEFRLKDYKGDWCWMISQGKNLLNDRDINGIVINFWDITKRKDQEESIEKNREELSKSQMLARIGGWQLNIKTRELTISKELMNLYKSGYDEVSLNYDYFLEKYVVGKEVEWLKSKFEEVENDFGNIDYSKRYRIVVRTKNQKGFMVLDFWSEVLAGEIIKGVAQDITEKVETEQKIIDSEKSYRELFDNAFDAIYILNSKGEFIDVNKGAEQMYGYPKDHFVGKTPEFLSAPGKNDLSDVKNKVIDAYNGISSQIEFWGFDINGRQFPKITKLTPGYYFGKKVVVAFAMDISELVDIQDKVAQKEKEYHRIFNAFPDIYFKSSYNGRILDVSPSAKAISGFDREEIIGKPSKSFYYLEDEYYRLGELLGESGSVKDVDFKLKIKGNKYLDCSFSGSLTYNEKGNPIEIEGVIRDISLRVKTLKKLIESEEKLREANLTKDRVFSIISHDLRGPISTNKSIVDLIVNEFERVSKDEVFKLLDSYKPTADATFFLLENLLSWSRSQMKQLSFHPGLNLIYTIVQENIKLYSSLALSKDMQLINKVNSNKIGFFDKRMLDIVIRNLISNAIKFTPRNGMVEIKSSVYGNFMYISVTDDGVGIPENQLISIFNDLDTNKITSVGTDNEKGAGLGLVLCKEFVEVNGGQISVESKLGKGSTFKFSIPLNENLEYIAS